MTLHPKEQMQALFAVRKREETHDFKDVYRHRAGIEGTHSQAVRTMGLRRSRYIGLDKTHLGHVAIAAAINAVQLMSWLRGDEPERIRTSPFKRLMQQARSHSGDGDFATSNESGQEPISFLFSLCSSFPHVESLLPPILGSRTH